MTQINTILINNRRIKIQKRELFYFLTWCWPCEQRWPCSAPSWWHNRRRTWRCALTSLWWWSSSIRSRPSHSTEQEEDEYISIQPFLFKHGLIRKAREWKHITLNLQQMHFSVVHFMSDGTDSLKLNEYIIFFILQSVFLGLKSIRWPVKIRCKWSNCQQTFIRNWV